MKRVTLLTECSPVLISQSVRAIATSGHYEVWALLAWSQFPRASLLSALNDPLLN